MVKPILKWVGGKQQIIDTLFAKFPTKLNNFRDIFVGGGSVLIRMLEEIKNRKTTLDGNIYAYDLNESLIYFYQNVQKNPDEVYENISMILEEFENSNKEDFYYQKRTEYNSIKDKSSIYYSSLFLFLNKTCFRGMYRTGPNGFNVPYGNYKKVIVKKDHLKELSILIQNVIFRCMDFEASMSEVQPGDFLYLDPPYYKENKTSFTSYNRCDFNEDDNIRLVNVVENIYERIALSNSDTAFIRENFTSKRYSLFDIVCRRAINSKNPGLKTKELLITNYL